MHGQKEAIYYVVHGQKEAILLPSARTGRLDVDHGQKEAILILRSARTGRD